MKHQPVKQGQTTTPGISSPTLADECAGSLTSPANHVTLKMQEMGPTVLLLFLPLSVHPWSITKCGILQENNINSPMRITVR